MKGLSFFVLIVCGLFGGAVRAEGATIEGRVIHPQRPEATAGVAVRVLGMNPDLEPIERSIKTDAKGRFRVSDLPTPAAYLVSASYQDVNFHGGSVIFREPGPDETRQLTFHIYDRSADAEPLVFRELRTVLNREAGLYRVEQNLTVDNPGLQVIARDPNAEAILRVGLAQGHANLEAPFGQLSAGGRVEGDEVRFAGPFYPGENQIQFIYDLVPNGTDLDLELTFPQAVALFNLYVKDFGIAVDAGPLHPTRPTRAEDVVFQRWVGFDVAEGSRIPIQVRALPPHQALPQTLRVALAALVTFGLVMFVLRPVSTSVREPPSELAESPAELTKQALVVALRDLEHDYETGKLSSEDHARLREDLRRQALSELAQEREPKSDAPAAPQDCACGNVLKPGDRFCSACGSPA